MNIEHGIPVPARHERRKYPFPLLEPGDSFETLCLEEDKKHMLHRVYSAATSWARYHRYDYEYIVAETENGVRCWRTK
jgi:hypothetical protein